MKPCLFRLGYSFGHYTYRPPAFGDVHNGRRRMWWTPSLYHRAKVSR
jgi:hypothetical protein